MMTPARAGRIETTPHSLAGWPGGALLLGLMVAGAAGNYFKYQIFLNIDFLFGSIFSLLALQFFGHTRGVIAAVLIATVTYFLWNHPYAILILSAEVAAVAWLIGRYKIGLVLADALYWLLVGMPLVYLFYHGAMNVPLGNTTIVMVKQAINGVANALLARLIFTAVMLRVRTSLIAYRDLIYNLLTFFALVPALILLIVASRLDYAETDQAIRTSLSRSSEQISARLAVWVQNRANVVVNLASLASTLTAQQMQSRLEQADASDVNFLRIGLLNRDATTVAFSPSVDELMASNIGKNFTDRPFISQLKRTLRPMLSEVVMAKLGVPKPMVTLLVPVVIDGEYGGYVSGILSLTQIHDYLERSAQSDTLLYTLRDKNGNVVLSNRPEQKVMMPMARPEGSLIRLDAGMSKWVPALPPNTPVSERWKSSYYVTESAVGELAEWSLILEQPVAPFQKKLFARYTDALSLLLLVLVATLILAELMSRRVVTTIEKLSALTHDLPLKLDAGQDTRWPDSALRELDALINNFKAMEATLAMQFKTNQELNASLENRVQERTAELDVSMDELRRSNADLEQFAYAASHDMRQPLRMISSYLQLLATELEPLLNDVTRENFHFATEGAQRLDQMLTALLDYSRAGRKDGNRANVDCRAVLADVMHTLQPAIAEAKATLRIEGEWPTLAASRDELQRLLQNLIDNALKYRLADRLPEIVISARREAAEWRFAVRDNGIGLLPGQATRLFKVFERLQPRSRYPGTGIGLALCRKIVEQHHGRIWVESAGENLGCTFVFTLPVADEAAVLPGAPA